MHTKGPWIIRKPQYYAHDQKNDRLIIDSNGYHIAEVFQYQHDDSPDGPSVVNAHLLKAAPDMHSSLMFCEDTARNLIAALTGIAGDSEVLCDCIAGLDDIVADSAKNIRKAKGE